MQGEIGKWREMVQQLANTLGTTIDHMWAVLTRQAYIDAWQSVFWMGIFLIVCIAVVTTWVRVGKRYNWIFGEYSIQTGGENPTFEVYSRRRTPCKTYDDETHYDNPVLVGWTIAAGATFVLTVLTFAIHLSTALTGFLNPEYSALLRVVKALGS